MPIDVQPDRVVIGSEFVPRFLDRPPTFVVVAGASAVLNAGTYDYIEIGGTLTIPAVDLKVTTLIVLPGGTLNVECGATIIGRNVPIDTTRDPFQWGNGLVNFGRVNPICPEKTPFVAFTETQPGATSISLESMAVGWAVGDALEFTDTRQMTALTNPPVTPQRETGVTIAAISGTSVTLSKPLALAHESIKRPDGSVVLQPRVANITRRTVITSENPAGVRWHVAMVGEMASWDVRGVAFVGLGRTTNVKIDNAVGGTAGTNQVGRYAFHQHHNGTSLETRRIASSAFIGLGVAKWGGVTVHQTHDTEILNNVCVDTLGACYVTEDGNEVRNVFAGNIALFVDGNGSFALNARQNIEQGCPGCEGPGLWLSGHGNTFEDNEFWNSVIGINFMNMRWKAVGVPIPSVKGDPASTTPVLENMVPVSFKRNVAAGNKLVGLEYWQLAPFPAEQTITAHNGVTQVVNAQPDGGVSDIVLVDSSVICQDGKTKGITSSSGYNTGVFTLRGEVRGCSVGVTDGIGKIRAAFTDTVFQNPYNFVFNQHQSWPLSLTFTRVKHEDYPGQPRNYLWFVDENDPSVSLGWADQLGARIVIEDWQGTGKNYRLVKAASERSTPIPIATTEGNWFYPPPDCGPTMGDSWDKCGMAYGGDGYAQSDAVQLEGVTNMLAASYPQTLGVPRTILTWPHRNVPVPPTSAYGTVVPFFLTLTGDRTQADGSAYFSIDGGPKITATNRYYGAMRIWYWASVTTTGGHTVRTWRERNGTEVPGSSKTFAYVVGAGTPPPPQPDPEQPPPPPPPPPPTPTPAPTPTPTPTPTPAPSSSRLGQASPLPHVSVMPPVTR